MARTGTREDERAMASTSETGNLGCAEELLGLKTT
eukprot:CAMPEP_0115223960 /NCGR_PEP_ID=MMETSP0270-20121206/29322_1 /TAXON_ID=71861 /ORGANISM="Scrippsiella trochoidea, Strain CCMP3099" /LENGTH=34 /DNA_ID= /DNA_START= /DNA_END= /DNA_ORIENTATION=